MKKFILLFLLLFSSDKSNSAISNKINSIEISYVEESIDSLLIDIDPLMGLEDPTEEQIQKADNLTSMFNNAFEDVSTACLDENQPISLQNILKKIKPTIKKLREYLPKAPARKYDLSLGPTIPVSHLSSIRKITKILTLESNFLIENNNLDSAIENLETIYMLSSHTAKDNFIISSLIAAGSVELTNQTITKFLKKPLKDYQIKKIKKLINSVTSLEHYRLAEACEQEMNSITIWVKNEFDSSSNSQNGLKKLMGINSQPLFKKLLKKVNSMSNSEAINWVNKSISNYQILMTRLVKAMRIPSNNIAAIELNKIDTLLQKKTDSVKKSISKGIIDHDLLSTILISSLTKARESVDNTRLKFQKHLLRLENFPTKKNNAADHYLNALNTAFPEQTFKSKIFIDPSTLKKTITDIFEATKYNYCDWTLFKRRNKNNQDETWWSLGLFELFTQIKNMSISLSVENKKTQSINVLNSLLIMTNHLLHSPNPFAHIIGSMMLLDLCSTIEELLESKLISPNISKDLLRSLELFDTLDPSRLRVSLNYSSRFKDQFLSKIPIDEIILISLYKDRLSKKEQSLRLNILKNYCIFDKTSLDFLSGEILCGDNLIKWYKQHYPCDNVENCIKIFYDNNFINTINAQFGRTVRLLIETER